MHARAQGFALNLTQSRATFVAAIFRESFICYDLSYEYINPSQGRKMCQCEIWKERVNIHLIKGHGTWIFFWV